MFSLDNMASNVFRLLGLSGTDDAPSFVPNSPSLQLDSIHSQTLGEKKAIVSRWLQTHGIDDPIHRDENGQETRFIDWAIKNNDLDFAAYLVSEKHASCDPQAQLHLQHFITSEMHSIINNANGDGKARIFAREIWADTGNPTSRLLSNQTVVSTDKASFAIKEVTQLIPCLQIGGRTASDPSVIRVADGSVYDCARGIHRLATWIAEQVYEPAVHSSVSKRRALLEGLETRRRSFFRAMYDGSNLTIEFWYEGLKKTFEEAYPLSGRNERAKKNIMLSYCTIVDEIKQRLSLEQRYLLLQSINKITNYSIRSSGIFYAKRRSDYELLYDADTEFSTRMVKMKESLQGWCPPEPFVDRFAPPPPPPSPTDALNSGMYH